MIKIFTGGKWIYLGPCSCRTYFSIYQHLIGELHEDAKSRPWAFVYRDRRPLMQQIINLIPRLDLPGEFGFDLGLLSRYWARTEDLFMNAIPNLHEIRYPTGKTDRAGGILSSGNQFSDLVADLINILPPGAESQYSLQEIIEIAFRVGQNRKDPKERARDAAWREIEKNPDPLEGLELKSIEDVYKAYDVPIQPEN